MDDYLEVKFHVFEHTDQRTKILKSLTIEALIGEILKEFTDIPDDSPEKYVLFLKGSDRPLPRKSTIAQLDIQPQDELVLDYIHQTIREMLDPKHYAFIQLESTGKRYTIKWQPAVIGRPSTDVNHNIMLAVNMQTNPNGLTVSRREAQITFLDSRYYIERLAEKNPVILNGKELAYHARQEIKNADRLMVGPQKIEMVFLTQEMKQPTIIEPGAQLHPPKTTVEPVSIPSVPSSQRNKSGKFFSFEKDIPSSMIVEKSTIADHIGRRQEISEYPFKIGRGLSILQDEVKVSREHAELILDRHTKKFYITDLHSTNGISINGVRIQAGIPCEITSGIQIQLGTNVVVRFEV